MKVSVLINNFNYGKFIDDCLLSIQNQIERADEVIFYDDGSSDNSIEVVSKYDFVKIIANKNYGKKPAFNQANGIYEALLQSTGDVICLLDSDDFWHPNKILDIKNAFIRNSKAVLVQHGYFEWVNQEVTRIVNFGKENTNYLELYENENWTGFFNPTSCFSFKRNYLLSQLPIKADDYWQVWPDVRLSRIAPYFGEVVCLKQPLTYYRRHGANDSQIMNKNHKQILKNQKLHHEFINLKIDALGKKVINYKFSFMYLKFFLKAHIVPNWLVRMLK